jgi:signal transduction histidine kinase
MQLDDQHRHSINLIDIGDRTHAWLDEALIYSVLSNLLSNAIKYSPEGSNIEFTLDGRKDLITFKVKDEGVGIEEEIQSVLFEPFRRGANVKNVNGTGLGLALVKRCLDLHQGQITYDSQIDKGTTFIVQIPQSINS